ncbi:MAG: Nif3-like dinuclear metal center hexameric protein [Bacteriovoracaceae bacterium]
MISQAQLHQYINQLLSSAQFEDYCPNGLQVEGKKEIKKIAFAVSATQESIDSAIQWGADALVVHHGIFWKYAGARPVTGAWGERVKRLIKNDINLYGYHLPLDAHIEVGNAATLARLIDLTELAPFGEYKRQPLGVKGIFKTPLQAKDLKSKLEGILSHEVKLATPDENATIRTMGIITGGANNEWTEAMKAGLDSYLTGEISEYNWHDAKEAGIHYFAGGHHATEKFGIQSLMKKIELELKLDCRFFDSLNPA